MFHFENDPAFVIIKNPLLKFRSFFVVVIFSLFLSVLGGFEAASVMWVLFPPNFAEKSTEKTKGKTGIEETRWRWA